MSASRTVSSHAAAAGRCRHQRRRIADPVPSRLHPHPHPRLQPAAIESAPSESVSTDFDPEIAAIFCEEAVELLEAAESALAAWNAAPQDREQAAALRRPLHTLKGGARMAGITAMGELSHELES